MEQFRKGSVRNHLLKLKGELQNQTPSLKVSSISIEEEYRIKRISWFQKVVDDLRHIVDEGKIEDMEIFKEIIAFIEYTLSPEFHENPSRIEDIKRAGNLIDKVTNILK